MLKVKVLKAGERLQLPAAAPGTPDKRTVKVHADKAAEWVPTNTIRIHAVSIPEQSEIAICADIEVSTAPEMYMPEGHIFRSKYAGPGLLASPAERDSYVGSNITSTNIVFPAGLWIEIEAGTPIYVHLDICSWAPISVDPMTQDIYLYYTRARTGSMR